MMDKVVLRLKKFLSGDRADAANDVVAVARSDGSIAATPFYVRFGSRGTDATDLVQVYVNGRYMDDLVRMKVDGTTGMAYFSLLEQSKSFHASCGMLKAMQLVHGVNRVSFVFGNEMVEMKLYFWDHSARIVVVDLDCLDEERTRALFPRIARNGFVFLYVSSQRMIGDQAGVRSQIARGGFPDGPCILTTFDHPVEGAFVKYMSATLCKKFYGKLLRDITASFREMAQQAFYAGFTGLPDSILFSCAGNNNMILGSRIYLLRNVQPHDESQPANTFCTPLEEILEYTFPCVRSRSFTSSEFNANNFWKVPLPI